MHHVVHHAVRTFAMLSLCGLPLREAWAWNWYWPTLTLVNNTSTQCQLDNFWVSQGYQSRFRNQPTVIEPGASATIGYRWQWQGSKYDIDNAAEFGFSCNGERFALQAKGNYIDTYSTVFGLSVMYLHFINPDAYNEARGTEDRGLKMVVVYPDRRVAPSLRINDGYAIDCAAYGSDPLKKYCSQDLYAFQVEFSR